MKIFLSVGRTCTDAQETYVRQLEDYLRAQGLVPQTVGRSYFSSQQPLKAIDVLMNECIGTIVVALERTFIAQAIDRRGSPKASPLAEIRLPTVWNQIEAAMAYARGHPLLVILEDGLKPEGLLEKGYDWYVLTADIDHQPFSDAESSGVFADWKARVIDGAARRSTAAAAPRRVPLDDATHRRHLTELRKQIVASMNDEELETLCFDLGVDYESLKGSGKEAKARELVLHCDRTSKLGELSELCRAMRPNLTWDEL
jgi:hypothetical protein